MVTRTKAGIYKLNPKYAVASTATMGGPSTRATGAMALVVAQIAKEQHFGFWPISPMAQAVLGRE